MLIIAYQFWLIILLSFSFSLILNIYFAIASLTFASLAYPKIITAKIGYISFFIMSSLIYTMLPNWWLTFAISSLVLIYLVYRLVQQGKENEWWEKLSLF